MPIIPPDGKLQNEKLKHVRTCPSCSILIINQATESKITAMCRRSLRPPGPATPVRSDGPRANLPRSSKSQVTSSCVFRLKHPTGKARSASHNS